MATLSVQLPALQDTLTQLSAQQTAPSFPQSNAALDVTQQPDTVTLVGRSAEGEQAHGESSNASFGQTAAFFFAERQTFRAANGSTAPQGSTQNSIPSLPVKTGADSAAPSAEAAPAEQQIALVGNATPDGTGASAGANQNSATGDAAGSAAGSFQTPQQQLAQLDQTLQQLGINPLSISLFNRMEMLLYASDPAALKVQVRQLEQGVQLAPESSSTSEPSTAAATATSVSIQANAPTGAASQNQSQPSQPEILAGKLTVVNQPFQAQPQPASSDAIQNAGLSTSSANSFSIQLEELQSTVATLGTSEDSGTGYSNSAAGQLLDVTA